MRTTISIASALTGTMLLSVVGWGFSGSAHAAPAPILKSDSGLLTPVDQGGGGGGA